MYMHSQIPSQLTVHTHLSLCYLPPPTFGPTFGIILPELCWIQLLCILSNSGSTFNRMYFPLFWALIHVIIAFISDLFTFDDYLSSIKQVKKMLSIKLKAWVKQVQAVLCLLKLK